MRQSGGGGGGVDMVNNVPREFQGYDFMRYETELMDICISCLNFTLPTWLKKIV